MMHHFCSTTKCTWNCSYSIDLSWMTRNLSQYLFFFVIDSTYWMILIYWQDKETINPSYAVSIWYDKRYVCRAVSIAPRHVCRIYDDKISSFWMAFISNSSTFCSRFFSVYWTELEYDCQNKRRIPFMPIRFTIDLFLFREKSKRK